MGAQMASTLVGNPTLSDYINAGAQILTAVSVMVPRYLAARHLEAEEAFRGPLVMENLWPASDEPAPVMRNTVHSIEPIPIIPRDPNIYKVVKSTIWEHQIAIYERGKTYPLTVQEEYIQPEVLRRIQDTGVFTTDSKNNIYIGGR